MYSRLMRISKKRLAIAALLMVMGGIVYQVFFADSHFDKFAKYALRDLDGNFNDTVATGVFNSYFLENDIADPITFLMSEMELQQSFDISDENRFFPNDPSRYAYEQKQIDNYVARFGPIKKQMSFVKEYHRRGFSFYVLRIVVTESETGEFRIAARIRRSGF